MAELGSYYITIMPSMKGFTSEVNKQLGKLGNSGGSNFSGGFMDVLKGSAVGTVLGNLATKAGSSIMGGLRTGIGRLDTIQNFPKVMESLGYSTDEADKSINTIMDHLDGLPTSTQDMVTLTQAISDSTGDLGLATKAALGFNDMMLANGASASEVATAQGVLNRVLGKGSATVAQWQSLTSVMPAQLGAVARKMLGAGASTEDLHAALEDGTVSWKDFLQAVVDLDEKGEGAMDSFYEQAKANSHGIGTALENIPNRIGAGWASILEALGREDISRVIDNLSYGVRDAMKGIAGAITDIKERLSETKAFENLATIIGNIKERFDAFSQTISGAVAAATPVIADLIDRALQWIVDHGDQIGNLVDGIGGALSTMGGAISDAIATASPVIGDLIENALQWILDHGDQISGFLQGFADAFSYWADIISGVFAEAAPVVADLVADVMQFFLDNGDTINQVIKDIADTFDFFAGILTDAFKDAAPVAVDFVEDVLQWFIDHGEACAFIIGGVAGALAGVAAASAAVGVFEGITTCLSILSMVTLEGGIGVALGNIGAAFGLMAESGGILAPVLGALGAAFSFLAANPLVLLAIAIGAAVGALVYFFTQTEAGQQIWQDFCTIMSDLWAGLQADWQHLCDVCSQEWESFQAFIDGIPAWWEGVKAFWSNALAEQAENFRVSWEKIKGDFRDAWENIKAKGAEVWENIKTTATTKAGELKNNLSTAWENVKSIASEKWDSIKSTIGGTVESIKSTISEKFNAAKDKALSIFDSIKNGIKDKIQWAKDRVSEIVDGIKGLFNFEWSLPAPKLPSIDWSWTDVGGIVSIPTFSVNWYEKGGVFDTATLIGIGEKGREAALPLNRQTYGEIARGIQGEMGGSGGVVVTGNTFYVREEADIDRIAEALATKSRRERMAMA